jgi:dUTP pyrophosphatase
MKIVKCRDVKTPSRGTSVSAGIDFYIPNDYILEPKVIAPGESLLIPSGIRAYIPEGYALIAFNKSGVATKQGLQVGAAVCDEDYEGEIHIHVTNVTNKAQTIQPGQKIVQFILLPILYADIELVNKLEDRNTERGAGGFGSTGL